MKVLIATDKFKGCLTANEVCDAVKEGVLAVDRSAQVETLALADGGDGSLAVVQQYTNAKKINCKSRDPLGREITAYYLLEGSRAYVELAVSSGIVLLADDERCPMDTSTYGTGQLIMDAIRRGAEEVYLFLGGSCTTEAGLGIATALGVTCLDSNGQQILPTGGNLQRIHKISDNKVDEAVRQTTFHIVCDVTNPLYGVDGAAFVYGPQKGASPSEVVQLDNGLRHVASLLSPYHEDLGTMAGLGAAGGTATAMVALFGGGIVSGMDFFTTVTDLDHKIQSADLIITGEGCIDSQTSAGKVVSRVAQLGTAHGKPVVAVCGVTTEVTAADLSLQQIYSVRERCTTDAESMTQAYAKLVGIASDLIRTHIASTF